MTATANGIGDVDKGNLRAELEKVGATVKTEGDDMPWEVVSGNYMFRINEDLSIDEISGIGISKKELKLLNGESETLTATVTEGITGTIKWETSDASVATVEDGTVTGVAEGTATITIKGKISTNVSTTCTVTVKKALVDLTAEQIAANKEKYYGEVAQNYTQGGLTYRIFYVDTENKFGDGANTVYLKADYKDEKSLSTDISSLTTDDIQKYKNMNPKWSAQRESVQSEWRDNEKGAVWLCAPSQWTKYVDDTKAIYAIGGPSVEMYVASYNDVPHTEVGNYTLRATYSTWYSPGYRVNGEFKTNDDTLDYKGYNSMYAGENGIKTGYWWLTSPLSINSSSLCCVYGSYASLNNYEYRTMSGVGPLVSLKSGIPVQVEE